MTVLAKKVQMWQTDRQTADKKMKRYRHVGAAEEDTKHQRQAPNWSWCWADDVAESAYCCSRMHQQTASHTGHTHRHTDIQTDGSEIIQTRRGMCAAVYYSGVQENLDSSRIDRSADLKTSLLKHHNWRVVDACSYTYTCRLHTCTQY